MDKIGELLGLPSGYEPAAVLKIGVPGEKGHAREFTFEESRGYPNLRRLCAQAHAKDSQ